MRRSIIQSVFRKELTELLRNRRSLMVMFGVPLVLYPALTVAVSSLADTKQKEMTSQPAAVIIVNDADAPELVHLTADRNYGIVASETTADNAEKALRQDRVDAIITAPPHYEAQAIAGQEVHLDVEVDSSRQITPFVRTKLDKVLGAYKQWIIERRLAAHGLAPDLASMPSHTVTDVATGQQTFGAFLSYILPLLLLLTGMLGALYPALSATTNERELGTLETLLATPATRGELLTAKAGIVLLSGLLTALLNMVSMSLVFWRVMSQIEKTPVGVSINTTALALSYLAAIPTLIFFTALVLMVGLLARNLREANAYATPLMMVPITSMLIGIADPAVSPGLLVTPVANTTIIIREVLLGRATFGSFALAFASSGLYAGLVLSLAGRLFTNEQLVNPAWEPISLRGFSHRSHRPRWPAVDEALALFSVSLLLNFYLSPSWIKAGLLPLLLAVETLLIAGPAIVFSWLGRYPWKEVFSLRRPGLAGFAGATLLGLGMIPLMNGLSALQSYWNILPPNDADLEGMTELLKPALVAHPFIAPIIIGALAGICEELLFRGPIQAAFVKRFPLALALTVGGLLFAAAHMDLSGMPPRMILGIILGWIVVRQRSIYPAMLMHAVYDGVSVAFQAHLFVLSADASAAASATIISMPLILAGLAASVAGWELIKTSATDRAQS
ncbi:MAG: ABC transporter permease subunit/CPBP intramembrane protease [Tepidisphaeraceae bacterium]